MGTNDLSPRKSERLRDQAYVDVGSWLGEAAVIGKLIGRVGIIAAAARDEDE